MTDEVVTEGVLDSVNVVRDGEGLGEIEELRVIPVSLRDGRERDLIGRATLDPVAKTIQIDLGDTEEAAKILGLFPYLLGLDLSGTWLVDSDTGLPKKKLNYG